MSAYANMITDEACKTDMTRRAFSAGAGMAVAAVGMQNALTGLAPDLLTANVHFALAGVMANAQCIGDLGPVTEIAMASAAGIIGGTFIYPRVAGLLGL